MTTEAQIKQKRELRKKVLEHFLEPQTSLNLVQAFPGYTYDAVRDMLYGLDSAGLIAKVRGTGPSSVYQTTDDGVILNEEMEGWVEINE